MGLSRTEDFARKPNEIALLAKAMAHPARISILQHLIKTRSCVCGEIVDKLPLSQSTVSQHLMELKKSGLIKGEINGPSVCYCIDEQAWKRAQKMMGDLFESYAGKDCC